MATSAPGAGITPRLHCGIVLAEVPGTAELGEVGRLYTEHGMWDSAFG